MRQKPWFAILAAAILLTLHDRPIQAQDSESNFHLRPSSNKDFESEYDKAQKTAGSLETKEAPAAPVAKRPLKKQVPEEDLYPPSPEGLTSASARAIHLGSADDGATHSLANAGTAPKASSRPAYPMPKNDRVYPQLPPPVYHSYPPATHSGFILEKRETEHAVTYTAFPARAREEPTQTPLNMPI